MLITKSVMVKWTRNNIKYYKNKGYEFSEIGGEFNCKIEDVSIGTTALYNVEVICNCPNCINKGISKTISYLAYNKNIKTNINYICHSCKLEQINSVENKQSDRYGHKITLNKNKQRICNIEGCNSFVRSCGLCVKHYTSMNKYGEIKRGKYDRNEIIEYENYAEVILYNINNIERSRALIDLEDVEKIKNIKWGYDGTYAVAKPTERGKGIYLHKFVMNVFDENIVDHISRVYLDCRKENLRKANFQQNSINKSMQCNNTSGITGVTWDESRNKWMSYLKLNRKNINLGRFTDFDEAVKYRELAELKYFGEFSPKFNLLKEKYIDYYNELLQNGELNKYVSIK